MPPKSYLSLYSLLNDWGVGNSLPKVCANQFDYWKPKQIHFFVVYLCTPVCLLVLHYPRHFCDCGKLQSEKRVTMSLSVIVTELERKENIWTSYYTLLCFLLLIWVHIPFLSSCTIDRIRYIQGYIQIKLHIFIYCSYWPFPLNHIYYIRVEQKVFFTMIYPPYRAIWTFFTQMVAPP